MEYLCFAHVKANDAVSQVLVNVVSVYLEQHLFYRETNTKSLMEV